MNITYYTDIHSQAARQRKADRRAALEGLIACGVVVIVTLLTWWLR